MGTYDAIIAGAGPAGSTAARLLAQRGAKVLLLDRARFPRDKPCGGGVTVHAAAELGIGISPVVERTVRQARISFRLGKPFLRSSASALTYMTQRRRLDAYLVEQAAAAGADFRDGVAVREVEAADGEAFRARTLVGADGANGAVARAVGLAPIGEALIALEGNVPASDGLAASWREAIALDLGSPAGGYGWLFRKGDHVNVGVIGWRRTGPQLRDRLSALCSHLGLDERQLQGLRGHHLPLRAPGAAIVRGPALLAGDAAGLVDPLSGEGIHAAFLSGRLAAEQIAAYLSGAVPDLSAYQAAIDRELMPGINFSRTLQAVFHLMPRPWISLLRHGDWFWRSTCRLMRGEATYAGFRRKAGPLSFGFDAAGRLAARRSYRGTPG